MKVKLLTVVAIGLLLGAEAPKADPAAKEVEKGLAALNEAFKNGNVDAVKDLMTEDHVAVTPYYGGQVNRAGLLKSLPDMKVTEYSSGKITVRMLGKDVALVGYIVVQKGTYKGKELEPRSYASALWVRQGGKWLETFYQETALG